MSKTKNGRLAGRASNPLVTVPVLELWSKWVKDEVMDWTVNRRLIIIIIIIKNNVDVYSRRT